jgi:hypothetical protein
MSATELVRSEYGSPDQRNRVSAIKDGPYTRRIVRDSRGRIAGVEGRSRLDDVVDRLDTLEVDALLADDGLTREQLDKALADLPAGVTCEELVAALGDLRASLPHGVTAADVRAMLSELRTQILAADRKITAGNVVVDERAVADVARRLELAYPLKVEWITPEQDAEWQIDGCYSFTPEGGHVLHVRLGLTAQRTAYVIAHEAAHASQLERLCDDFPDVYREHRDELEAEARRLGEAMAADVPIAMALA